MKSRQSEHEVSRNELPAKAVASDSKSLAKLMLEPQSLCFPFQDSVRPEESGQGYALRMAEENGLAGLPPLKTWLGKSRFAALDAADAPMLHRWFGADEDLLAFALGRTATGRRDTGYAYAGQSMGRSYFLNRTYPRVCPECLKENGRCLIAWDMSLVVACVKHHRTLMDCCDYCQRALSWNRPRLGICSCSMEMGVLESSQTPTSLEIQFATWVSDRVSRYSEEFRSTFQLEVSEMTRPMGLTALMRLIWPLSLDGGFHIAYALGTAAGYDEQHLCVSPRPKTPLKKARQVLRMANELAEKIIRLEPVEFRVSRPSVVVQLLAESACAQGNSADRSLAQSILVAVMHNKNRSTLSGQNPHLAQLPLF